jgi:hypothetical protein
MMTNYPHNDFIKTILIDMAPLVQRDGLNYLVPAWRRFAEKYAGTESLIYEWLNDLDIRKIIDEVLDVLPDSDRAIVEADLKPIDTMVIEKTFEVNECVWGEVVERENNFGREKHWYYYRANQNVLESEKGRFTKRKLID